MYPCTKHIRLTNPNKVKDSVYDDSDIFISATPRTIKLFLPGDLNASNGTDHQSLEGVMGSGGVGNGKSNVDSCF